MADETTHRFVRLLRLLEHIRNHPGQSAEQLAANFSQSKRNLYRDLKLLEEAGFPIQSEGGYRLQEGRPADFGYSPAHSAAEVELVCKIDSTQANRYRQNPLHPTQRLDGNRMVLTVTDPDSFVDWLLGHPEIELVEPSWLRRSLRRRAQELVDRYS